MHKKYVVRLTAEERTCLESLMAAGTSPARTQPHARSLLKADWGPDHASHEALAVSLPTIQRGRQTLVLAGFDAALQRKRPPARPRKRDGAQAAQLIALACSTPPAGHKRWSLRLLTKRFVELEHSDRVGRERLRQVLNKTTSNRG